MLIENENDVKVYAIRLKVSKATIKKWVKEYREDKQNILQGCEKLKLDDKKMKIFIKQIINLKEENEVLKKTVAILSNYKDS